MKPETDGTESLSFEGMIEKLQSTVRSLESGELSMEDSLKAFEQGVQLARRGQQLLAQAEQRVELLMQVTPEGRAETRPFAVAETPNEGSGGPRG